MITTSSPNSPPLPTGPNANRSSPVEFQPHQLVTKQSDDQVVRDRQQPPLDQHQPTGKRCGVDDIQRCRIVGCGAEGERRILVGAETATGGVVGHPPRPAEHTAGEVEQRTRVAAGEQDAEPGNDGDHQKCRPEKGEHQVVRDGQEPFHQPLPAAQPGIEAGGQRDRVIRCRQLRRHRLDSRKSLAASRVWSFPRLFGGRPTTISTTAPAVITIPEDQQGDRERKQESGRAPRRSRPWSTPADPSAFMITTAHWPLVGLQLSAWVPGPDAVAVQKVCSTGGATVAVPATVRYIGVPPLASPVISSWATPLR